MKKREDRRRTIWEAKTRKEAEKMAIKISSPLSEVWTIVKIGDIEFQSGWE